MDSKWIFLALFLVLAFLTCSGFASSSTVRKIRNNKPHTKIACEGETLNITCPHGYVINILLANYGRFSIHECNERSELWTVTQCMYPLSTRVMQERCGNRSECWVEATNENFGDSCPSVSKYLDAKYECVPLAIASITSTAVPVLNSAAESSTSTPSSIPTDSTESTRSTASTPQSFTIQQVLAKPTYCPEIERRGLRWPATRLNNPAKLPCPNNADAYAEWWCGGNGEWISENPDLSRCVSTWARQLDSQSKSIDNEEAAKTIARNLQADTRTNRLYGGDTSTSVDVMHRLSESSSALARIGAPSQRKIEFVTEVSKYLVETGSNLLQEERRSSWLDLPSSNQSASGDRLLSVIEDMAVVTANQLDGSETSVPFVSPKISVEISRVQIQDYVQFPARSLYEPRLDNIQLPRAALEMSGHGSREWSKVTFVSYDALLGDYMRPEAAIVMDENGAEMIVERRIVSKLMSASIVKWDQQRMDEIVGEGSSSVDRRRNAAVARIDKLPKPVLLTFALWRVDENMSNAMCVYWRSSERTWSPDGCEIRRQNATHVTCSCDHLTTFAVLMDVRGLRMDPVHQLALSFITCVGCFVSIFCCAAAIVAFSCFSGNHYADRTTIHKNLCFCLMVAESIFLFGIAQTQDRLACSIVAGFLHYFFLASFAWMLLEGFQLYSLLIEVFESERSRKPYYYLFGYGMPAVIVGISVLVDHSSYGTRRHCWLNTDNYFVFSFVGPVAVVLMANLIFLAMAFVVMCRHAHFVAAHRHEADRSVFDHVAVWLRGSTILVILLGLTWAIGLLYINDSTLVMAYIFTVLNSLQGCFIFLFHVVLNEKMRKEMNKWLIRRQLRTPAWMRSPTAATADYKPAKAHHDEPMPMLIGVTKSSESDTMQTPLGASTGSDEPSLLAKLFGSQKQRNGARGSVGQLLIRSGSMNSCKVSKYEYPYGSHSSSSEAATNSDLLVGGVESPCPRYSISPRPPPSFPPPSPPRPTHHPIYYARQQQLRALNNHDRHYGAIPELVGGGFEDEHDQQQQGGDDGGGNPYATTDAYFPVDSDRPDSGYSGSAHRPTPPPPVVACCVETRTDSNGGVVWPGAYVRRVPSSSVSPPYSQQHNLVNSSTRATTSMQRKRDTDLNYEVPVHGAVNT